MNRGRTGTWNGQLAQVTSVSPREAVAEQILALIRSGSLKPGDRLPSESEQMAMTGVSRPSVREAIRSLASMQLVEIRRGKGTYVQKVATTGMSDAQVLLMLGDAKALQDLVEVRLTLEPLVVRLAAQRADDQDIQALARAVDGMREARDQSEWRQAHLDFHLGLAQASHNIILTKMWALVQMFLKDSPMVTGSPSPLHVHENLYQAIADRDPERAYLAMESHLQDMESIVEK
jgi:GntR family transcriptional regulator, transcriptional repressor for pyruvate dehydrogenase complex